jgi:2,4-dienoyl-CoA reductase-like NADH-dependent reductase (Old Yellow Enzyme family)/thioredoxin reductase
MTKFPHVFSPFKIGNTEVKNRIEVAPMGTCLPTPEGRVTRELVEFYKTVARGGPGTVVIGECAVDDEYARAHVGLLHAGDDGAIPGLNALAEAVQRYGARISIELNHSGRLVHPNMLGGKSPIAPSPIMSAREELSAQSEGREPVIPREMDQEMIESVIAHFVAACNRCLTAGFEMVMLHGGHGQLLGQFLSSAVNRRTDKYGGSLENRSRFALEVLTAIRKKVGNKLAIEYRISADELIPEGTHLEETIEFLKVIKDKIDLVNVSLGGIFDARYTPFMSQPTYLPYMYNAGRAGQIKEALKIPVTAVGSIMDLEMAEEIIAQGKADIVAMGRAQLADPDLVGKSFKGQAANVRPCIRCSTCGVRSVNMQVRCVVNPVACRELEYPEIGVAKKRKKVVIVGGGPAGMQAALIACARGHKVTILEKEKALGGSLIAAAAPDFKPDMKKFLAWLIRETQKSGAEIKLSTEVKPGLIKSLKPDVLIVAAGADPLLPDIISVNGSNVVTAADVDTGKAKTGNKVLVVGAGMTGCETALHLALKGSEVTLVDMVSEAEIAADTVLPNRIVLLSMLQENNIKIMPELKLFEINEKAAVVEDKAGARTNIVADTIVLATGVKPRSKLADDLKETGFEFYIIGDCSRPRNLMGAIHDGFNVAVEL